MQKVRNEIESKLFTSLSYLENETISNEINTFKTLFDESKLFFEDHFVKIALIGSVSVGKTSLINKLLSRNIFSTETVHSTITFFYCASTKKDYEYFTINGSHEITDISILKNFMKPEEEIKFVDEVCNVNVFLSSDGNSLFKNDTVVADCPGLLQKKSINDEIKKHCENADIIIFIQDVQTEITRSEIEFISEIFNYRRIPALFFVRNKSDLIDLNLSKQFNTKSFKEELSKIKHFKINDTRFYFLSAKNTQDGSNSHLCENEFNKLVQDLLKQIDIRYIRLHSKFGEIINSLKSISNNLRILLDKERFQRNIDFQSQTVNEKRISELNAKLNDFKKSIASANEKSLESLKKTLLGNFILKNIMCNYEKCDKDTAKEMIKSIATIIDKKVIEKVKEHATDNWCDDINFAIETSPFEIHPVTFNMNENVSFVDFDDNDLKIFWFFEFGDKTEKVKKYFYDHTKNKINEILESIYCNYNDKISKIGNSVEKQANDSLVEYTKKLKDVREKVIICDTKINFIEEYSKKYENVIKEMEVCLTRKQ